MFGQMRKKVLWACVTLGLSAFAICALFYNGGFSFAEFLQDIKNASPYWLCAASAWAEPRLVAQETHSARP